MREKLTIFNAFVHDVATGTWIGTLVLLTILHRETRLPGWEGAAAVIPGLERKFLVLTWVSLLLLGLAGLFFQLMRDGLVFIEARSGAHIERGTLSVRLAMELHDRLAALLSKLGDVRCLRCAHRAK